MATPTTTSREGRLTSRVNFVEERFMERQEKTRLLRMKGRKKVRQNTVTRSAFFLIAPTRPAEPGGKMR